MKTTFKTAMLTAMAAAMLAAVGCEDHNNSSDEETPSATTSTPAKKPQQSAPTTTTPAPTTPVAPTPATPEPVRYTLDGTWKNGGNSFTLNASGAGSAKYGGIPWKSARLVGSVMKLETPNWGLDEEDTLTYNGETLIVTALRNCSIDGSDDESKIRLIIDSDQKLRPKKDPSASFKETEGLKVAGKLYTK